METKQEKIVITEEWPCLVIMNRIEVDYTESDEDSIELHYTGKRPDVYVEFSPEDPEDLHCLPSVIVAGEDTLQYREDVKVIIRHKGLVRLCCCKGGKAVLHGTIPLSESFLQLDSAVDAKMPQSSRNRSNTWFPVRFCISVAWKLSRCSSLSKTVARVLLNA